FFFVMVVAYSYWLIVKSYKSLNSLAKNQVNYIFIASVINYFGGGLMAFLPVFDIKIYPYGMFIVPIYSIMLAYAILRHRLMDIEIVIKKGIVYSAVTVVLSGLKYSRQNLFRLKIQISGDSKKIQPHTYDAYNRSG
ncbi:MAG: hypothetical protein NT030_08265, partial [Candidatus Saganbacteria bacterium]|nr:hypothetical protein [Candidatus Saganbacteria bacterium]